MTKTQPAEARKRDEGSRSYLLFALVALLIILLGLIQRGNTLWTVLLLLVTSAPVPVVADIAEPTNAPPPAAGMMRFCR